jgi:miniconductance mechanosensitive channel
MSPVVFASALRRVPAIMPVQTSDTTGAAVQDSLAATGLQGWLDAFPLAETGLWVVGVLFFSWLADLLAKQFLLQAISRVVKRTRFTWDDAIQERRVFNRLAHIAPAAVIYYGALLIPGLSQTVSQGIQRVALALMVLAVAQTGNALLSAANDIYSTRPDAKDRPIKGYLQIVSIVIYVTAGILVVSLLMDRNPVVFLGGLGALTAVVLLVFRDTILSLVASIQLTQNDMIAVGDWIEMPQYGADGEVVDIALHTVKVQNWDKTISSIPTHKLIEDSFKNWRGMSEAGGRRVKRSLFLDLSTVRFLTEEEIEKLSRFELLKDYVARKREELEAYRRERSGKALGTEPPDSAVIPNPRGLTNAGTLRAYIVAYLRQHPLVHGGMTLLVRQLQSGPHGLPIEIYVFCSDTDWIRYEAFQSDIFDHVFAMLPEFGLRVFQSPGGGDLRSIGAVLAQVGEGEQTPPLS